MGYIRAFIRWRRERPRTAQTRFVLVAVLVLLLSRYVPGMTAAVAGLVAVVAAALALFVPTAIHEAHGRWQLRPRCWEEDGQWWLAVDPRWREDFRGACVVTDEIGRSASGDVGKPGDRAAMRFPQEFDQVQGTKAGTVEPQGRYLVHWTVRQAGNTFEANAEFVWR